MDEVIIYRAVMQALENGFLCETQADYDHQTSTIPCYLRHPWQFNFYIKDTKEADAEMRQRARFAQHVVLEALKQREGKSSVV